MAYIRVDVSHTVKNGTTVSFKAPCDCSAVAGLKAYFPDDKGIATNQTFLFTDAHGNNLTGIGHLFAAGAIVKVILNVDESKAYIQNADTNAYLEGRLDGKADLVGGKVPAAQLPAMNYIPTKEKGVAKGVATLGTDGKVPTDQLPAMNYIPTKEKGAANGVATLNAYGKLLANQLPEIEHSKIKVGTYVGTGTYGESNPNTLPFDGPPQFLWVQGNSTYLHILAAVRGVTETGGDTDTGLRDAVKHLDWGDKSVSWYSGNSENQLNENGTQYFYLAIL